MWSRSNVVLELFAQIINESCYDQLRTKVCILPTLLLEPSAADPESGSYLASGSGMIAGSRSHPYFWDLSKNILGSNTKILFRLPPFWNSWNLRKNVRQPIYLFPLSVVGFGILYPWRAKLSQPERGLHKIVTYGILPYRPHSFAI